ncbi:MAG: Bax inhibitor-1/YccA family protein [Pseudomonadales bacterium]|nr:Bax inhibitor-1/YccA family protein [Pseudomonadales bacterium]
MADAQFIPDQQTNTATHVVATNKVLRNTYMLLSMTLLFSAAMAGVAMAMNVPHMGFMPLILSFVLIFAINKMRNSMWGILLVFAFTGILGFALGPLINYYVATSGSQTVVTAAGLTGLIFFSLSAYTLLTRKDFSYMSGFLMTGMVVVIGCMLISFIGPMFGFHIPGLSLAVSAAVVMLMSGFILYDTSKIINGGETNYIMATVALYLDIYNIFVSLLHLIGFMNDD